MRNSLGAKKSKIDDTRDKIKSIVSEALYIQESANSLMNKLIDKSNFDKTNNFAEYLNKQLSQKGLYGIVCGTSEPQVGRPAHTKNKLFWDSFHIAVSDQFEGFAIHGVENCNYLVEQVFRRGDNGKVSGESAQFWGTQQESNGSTSTFEPTRYWFLIAYHSLFQKFKPKLWDKFLAKHLNSIAENCVSYAEKTINKPSICITPNNDRKHVDSKEIVSIIRTLAVNRLLCKIFNNKTLSTELKQTKQQLKKQYPEDSHLLNDLQWLVALKNCPVVAISLLMRTLGGRYINGTSRCEPGWKERFLDGVDYVLNEQDCNNGKWKVGIQDKTIPLLHPYAPLLHLLDLSLDVLRERQDEIIQATSRTLLSLKRDLDICEGELGRVFENKHPLEKTFKAIFSGMSLGASVYDRFKDILSDFILDDFGAIEVPPQRKDNIIPEALGFRENIERGVISQWKKESAHRPGAVMVFGPPGTGKTTIAKWVTGELNENQKEKGRDAIWRFLSISPADFARDGTYKIVANAEKFFNELISVRRCVVLLDEMEEFLRTRGPGSDRESRLVTTAFLPLLQEAVSSREIILIVATNFVGNIDPAVTRRGRFDLLLPLGPPDPASREKILLNQDEFNEVLDILEEKRGGFISKEFFITSMVEYTMGYSLTEIKDFVLELIAHKIKIRNESLLNDRSLELDLLQQESSLLTTLWEIRSEKIPTALSMRTGCNWRIFQDEALRYARYSSEVNIEDWKDYWIEPKLPSPEKRTRKNLDSK